MRDGCDGHTVLHSGEKYKMEKSAQWRKWRKVGVKGGRDGHTSHTQCTVEEGRKLTKSDLEIQFGERCNSTVTVEV